MRLSRRNGSKNEVRFYTRSYLKNTLAKAPSRKEVQKNLFLAIFAPLREEFGALSHF
jgi:hypothetical protein